ncbi:related to Sulfate permease 2 [Cephalotrichum gorgonifer]|uniref:Related to Sulfate permease 2 n=1 Tax=Cephalotrichum gorgonifer TaxID=2041049 RepID=A0AAE8MSS7_9PEZI|nr:related to Sulfate permease 2 [Cephalotrichum gorgonifer]
MSFTRKLAKAVGIDVDENKERLPADFPEDAYIETVAGTEEFIREILPTGGGIKRYFLSLFPFLTWIHHYNFVWLAGDIIAGVTVGFVVVPQGMAYALLAKLSPEFGLYTSFVGFILYWAFATSKDITIGTVAVMSTIVGNIVVRITEEDPDISAEEIARSLALISGAILLFIGFTRLGFIVEFIPLVAITSFMTGAAISIAAGQVPAMMGIKNVNTRGATYKVIIDTLKALPTTKIDAAMGLSALVMLYAIRIFCSIMGKRFPNQRKAWFFVSTLRMVFVILLYTMISWLVNRHVKGDAKKAMFSILGHVPSGFQHAGAPKMRTKTLKAIASDIPTTVIVLIIEHIAISKSFGRINNYRIDPSQELVAVGFTNLLGPFLGGYPATGSFSRTAIKAKAGVRTPLAGVFTAVIVLLALYALTSVFFYIPKSSLSGLIIHAVLDLITPPKTVYQFWKTSPLEVIIFFAGVFASVFSTIENGIYVTVALSAAVLLWNIARSHGKFLGQVQVVEGSLKPGSDPSHLSSDDLTRKVFAPLDHRDGINPAADIQEPYPGVFIYRFAGGFNYINSDLHFASLSHEAHLRTRQTETNKYEKKGDRPWNNPGPRRGQQSDEPDTRPLLRAIILDFSTVNFVDATSIQALVDVRNQLARHATPEVVEWHFTNVTDRWTKRALVANGFGFAGQDDEQGVNITLSIAGAADKGTHTVHEKGDLESRGDEIRPLDKSNSVGSDAVSASSALYGANWPFFHPDLQTATKSAIESARKKNSAASF